jgi:hypothetical protein
MTKTDDRPNVIVAYTLEQAIADGALEPIFKNRWPQLTGGKPIVATAHIMEELSLAALFEIWNEYVGWRRKEMPTLPEEGRTFSTTMNGNEIWVIEDGQAFTILSPEDY